MFRSRPELRIVGEASDGPTAVQKAQELQPDLILLDIRLPILNGIEAARRIRSLAPDSKILFVTENYSADIAREALRSGGSGYVIKSDAGSELLAAVDAVILGRQFVSARLARQLLTSVTKTQAFDRLHIKEVLASLSPRLPRNRSTTRHHEGLFYSDDAFLLDGLSRFVGAALSAGGVVVALATKPHRPSFVEGLQGRGIDVSAAMKGGRYTLLDVDDALSTFMTDDGPDPVRYLEGLADLLDAARRAEGLEHSRVAVCGELAAPLLVRGAAEAVIQIEQLSNEFANEYEIDILCMYPAHWSHGEEADQIFHRICAEHSTVSSQ